jgi:hypothetical protein
MSLQVIGPAQVENRGSRRLRHTRAGHRDRPNVMAEQLGDEPNEEEPEEDKNAC